MTAKWIRYIHLASTLWDIPIIPVSLVVWRTWLCRFFVYADISRIVDGCEIRVKIVLTEVWWVVAVLSIAFSFFLFECCRGSLREWGSLSLRFSPLGALDAVFNGNLYLIVWRELRTRVMIYHCHREGETSNLDQRNHNKSHHKLLLVLTVRCRYGQGRSLSMIQHAKAVSRCKLLKILFDVM